MKIAAVLIFSAAAVSACGGRHRVETPGTDPGAAWRQADARRAAAAGDTLEDFAARMRKLSEEARPVPAAARAQTLENTDPRLAGALATALLAPSARAYRAVAAEYRRLDVFDKAHQYLTRAAALEPTDGATYDALARLWRDAGFPQLGLADAYRAVYYEPASATMRNTLGTVLQALGHRTLARAEYLRALELDPGAAYALNNLCYGYVLDAEPFKAIDACERALRLQPDMAAAHNNLGLAHASAGNGAAAQQAFAAAGDRATALYNTGIVHLAQRRYGSAVTAFQAAHALRPTMSSALARANQAKAAAASGAEE